jgi:cell division protease FtsH
MSLNLEDVSLKDMTRTMVLWLVIVTVLFMVLQNFSSPTSSQDMAYSEFITSVKAGQVDAVTFQGSVIRGTNTSGEDFKVFIPYYDEALLNDLYTANVKVTGEPVEQPGILENLFYSILPVLIIVAVFIFFMRQMQGGGGGKGGPMSFGKSKARLLSEDEIKTSFADVAGVDEAKEEVSELVEYLRDPSKFQRLGGKIPRGVMMAGPPGTGKTLLAKAIAGEARVPFFSISGSDFVEMFVGVGASRVRDMFEQAKKRAPCIIFIDEIDAVGRHRGGGVGGGNDEREQTLNQLLVEMDGFEGNEGVIVIAASNRPDVLDSALLRPGRFDRQVFVGLPDIRGREQILRVHLRKTPVADNVNVPVIARGTPGFSGADLANLVNEASLFAARMNKRLVSMDEFERARDKIMMGAERKSMVMSESEKVNTAYHEAGHAIIGRLVPDHDPVHKVSIIPRGRALGVTQFLPEEDKYSISKRGLESQICALFGGRIAEEMTLGFDGVTTGAQNDIERATTLATNMVTKWGLSESLGPLNYAGDEAQAQQGQQPRVSGETAKAIDTEVRRITDFCYDRASTILKENRDILESMKDALMEYETIDSLQVDDLMNRTTVRPPSNWETQSEAKGYGAAPSEEPSGEESQASPSDDAVDGEESK